MEKVLVLMSTYDGEKYLKTQIDTVLAQEGVEASLLVRDDGSSDNTMDILEDYSKRNLLTWYKGENLRSARSFMDLIKKAPKFDYYAFCDQDDFWEIDKLQIAVEKLKTHSGPCLYYGAPRLVDEELNRIESSSNMYENMTTFPSALINSKATGCTMVFNDMLMNILRRGNPEHITMHDGWVHKVCLAIGGEVIFDPDVHILYRQHTNNVVGVSNSIKSRILLYFKEFKESDCLRSNMIKSILLDYENIMPIDNKKKALLVSNYNTSVISKLKVLFSKDIRTDYFIRNILFKLSILFGKF